MAQRPVPVKPRAEALEGLLRNDAGQLEQLMQRIAERQARRQPVERELATLDRRLAEARRRAERRRASVPPVCYPPELPVSQRIDEIREAIVRHQVIVVCGETGSGKTTQLPKACLEAGRGLAGLIGHTQPRRIAARSVAMRLAEELGVELGAQVGFKVRFAEQGSDRGLIRVMTDGILLAEIQNDPDLSRYDTLIIDEAHERSLNIDFLLGYLKRLLPRRPDLRVVITSATIDPQSFSRFFDGAPVIEVSGRGWPIDTRYRPLGADEDDDLDPGVVPGIVAAVRELAADGGEQGDTLVFLPGEREIRDAAEALSRAFGPRLEVLPLFSRLSWSDQQRVFKPGPQPRVVLATNVAETSITVPRIRAVVDTGLARIGRYSARSKILRLPIEPVSQASANQRQGRCGRVGPGVCIRLYSEEDFEAREPFTPPEILRTNLASVILQMQVLGLGAVDEFPFPDPPDTRLINDGYRLLQELEAVDDARQVTDLGRQIARMPVDPQLGRMLAEARRFKALDELLTLVAVLSIRDPRERPSEFRAAADEKHSAFADPRSDFLALLNLWRSWQEVRAGRSGSQARRWCRDNFLSAARMREWEDLRAQLQDVVAENDWRPGNKPASAEAVHRSLLPGLLGHIGEKTEKGDYLGARGLRFVISPGSALKARPPKWVVAATLAETHRVYARTVAAIEPAWIETAAHHLVRRSYGDPEWVEQRGYVAARETVTLYGLTIAAGRRVNYGSIAPAQAREMFVREALTHGRSRLRGRFLARNARVRSALEAGETKLRRRGVLVDEELITAFYLGRIPEAIHSTTAFERWRKPAEERDPGLLEFSEADVKMAGAPAIDPEQLPDTLRIAGHELPLEYRFEPGADDDGATVTVPLAFLPQLSAGEIEWGIPGWRHEMLTESIRGLPKALRRHLVPAPDVAARCLEQAGHPEGASFFDVAAAWLTRRAGMPIAASELRSARLPEHLSLNIRVVDPGGRALAAGRDVEELKRRLRSVQRKALQQNAGDFVREGLRSWDFEALPETLEIVRQGVRIVMHPAIEDRGDSVALTCLDTADRAIALTRQGIVRLLALRLEPQLRYVRRALAADTELALLHQPVGPLRGLADAICDRAVERCCLPAGEPVPRDRAAFEVRAEQGRAELYDEAMRIRDVARRALAARREAIKALDGLPEGTDPVLIEDCRAQVAALAEGSFVAAASDPWFDSLPRFLKAAERRIARLRGARGTGADSQYELRQWREAARTVAREANSAQAVQPAEAVLLRWMVEEYGVSLFAQELRTSLPVSPKRLSQQLDRARAAVSA
ncbi:MAG TPA: ATP-dependent RNA helicase HrpA [Steroidobacteraceae bacterium]|nr:ATP-dependent RNA helicase HrpA [Steroidobacteraceae bacterium]